MASNWSTNGIQMDDGVLVLDFPDQLHEMIPRQRNNPRIYTEEVLIIDDGYTNFQDHQPQLHHQTTRQRNFNSYPRRYFYTEEVAIIDGFRNFQDHQPLIHHRTIDRNFYPRRPAYNEEVPIIGHLSNSSGIYHHHHYHHHHYHHQNLQRINGRRWVDSGMMHLPVLVDIDRMGYEELLAFQETIGTIKTGLSEEIILSQLKTRICQLNESQDLDHNEICTICQSNYENGEKIGILHCGHEYHENCIKKWLMEKNVCPICKRPALEDQTNRHEL